MLILAGIVGEDVEDKHRILGYKVYEIESQSLIELSREEAESGDFEIIGLEPELEMGSLYEVTRHLMIGTVFDADGNCISSVNLLPVFDSEYDTLISVSGLKEILTVKLYYLDPINLVIDLESLEYSLSVPYSNEANLSNGYCIDSTTSKEDEMLYNGIKSMYEYTESCHGCFSLGSIAVMDYSNARYKNLVLPNYITEICLNNSILGEKGIVVPPSVTKIAYLSGNCYIPDFKLYMSKNSDISLVTGILIREADVGGLEVVKPLNHYNLTDDEMAEFDKNSTEFLNKVQNSDKLSLSDIIDDLHRLGMQIELY